MNYSSALESAHLQVENDASSPLKSNTAVFGAIKEIETNGPYTDTCVLILAAVTAFALINAFAVLLCICCSKRTKVWKYTIPCFKSSKKSGKKEEARSSDTEFEEDEEEDHQDNLEHDTQDDSVHDEIVDAPSSAAKFEQACCNKIADAIVECAEITIEERPQQKKSKNKKGRAT